MMGEYDAKRLCEKWQRNFDVEIFIPSLDYYTGWVNVLRIVSASFD